MAEKMIILTLTPMQANYLAISVKLATEVLSVAPGTPVYPNLGEWQVEREMVKSAIGNLHKEIVKQLEGQMPKTQGLD